MQNFYHSCKLCPFKTTLYFKILNHVERHRLQSRKKLFNCASSDLELACAKCVTFRTDSVAALKEHIQGGHINTNPILTETAYACKCSFETHSRYLLFRHRMYDCLRKDTVKISVTKRRPKGLKLKPVEKSCRYKCKYCPQQPRSSFDLERHILSKHTDRSKIQWLKCDQCDAKFTFKEALKRHSARHANPARFAWLKCKHCEYKAKQSTSLKYHNLVHHSKPEEIVWFQCKSCPHKTKHQSALREHTRIWHSANSKPLLQCELCPYRAREKKNLLTHFADFHQVTKNKTKLLTLESGWFKCNDCDYKSNRRPRVQAHITSRHKDDSEIKWFQCELCSFKTKLEGTFRRHQKTHQEKAERRKYYCAHCGYETINKHTLKNHMVQKHTDPERVQWYNCEQCSYRSRIKSILTQHIRCKHHIGTTKKLYTCEHCPYKTVQKGNFTRHQKGVHDIGVDDWFKCDKCPYKTKVKDYLYRHNRTKHCIGANMFQCKYCPYKTPYNDGYQYHMRMHEVTDRESAKFKCAHCSFKVNLKVNLIRHLKSVHQKG